jgi:hypothetical protein
VFESPDAAVSSRFYTVILLWKLQDLYSCPQFKCGHHFWKNVTFIQSAMLCVVWARNCHVELQPQNLRAHFMTSCCAAWNLEMLKWEAVSQNCRHLFKKLLYYVIIFQVACGI